MGQCGSHSAHEFSCCSRIFVKRRSDANLFIKHMTVPSRHCGCALCELECSRLSTYPSNVTPSADVIMWISLYDEAEAQNAVTRAQITQQRFMDSESLRFLKLQRQTEAAFKQASLASVKQNNRRYPTTQERCNDMLSNTNAAFDHRVTYQQDLAQTLTTLKQVRHLPNNDI